MNTRFKKKNLVEVDVYVRKSIHGVTLSFFKASFETLYGDQITLSI